METKPTVESSQPRSEQPEHVVSAAAGDQPASPQDTPARPIQEQLPAELVDLINTEIERRFQSAKDRRWAQLERQYGNLHELNQKTDPPLPGPQPSEAHAALAGRLVERTEALLKRLGLRSAPEAAALLRGQDPTAGPGGYLELVNRALDLALREVGDPEQQAPSPTGVIAPGGGSVSEPDLAAAYRQRRKHLRPGDVNALTALKREFREKGLNIF